MLKELGEQDYLADFVVEFEPPEEWEEVRDLEGRVIEGCYRTKPALMSDDL